jgi:hypothetical protein
VISLISDRALWRTVCVVALGGLVACSVRERSSAVETDPALRGELLTRVARDQAVRDTFATQLQATGTITPALVASMRHVDSLNLEWLTPFIRTRGFPTRAAVGHDGVLAAALLVQHADADPAFQAEVLPMLAAAYRAGDVAGQEIAMLTDRVATAHGRPQAYGTQTTIRDGVVRFDPIADSATVDARRLALGLPLLVVYKRALDSLYAQRRSP